MKTPRRNKILLAISDLGGGGAERQFSLLARHLSRQRFEPHVVLWRNEWRYDLPSDLPVHMLEKTRAWHVVRAVRDTRRLVDRLQPDLVFSQLHYVNMVMGTALARSRHRPRWVCRQSNDPRREMRGPFAWWARWAVGRADAVVCCSHGVRQATIDHLRVDPQRAETVDNLADVAAIQKLARAEPGISRRPGTFVFVHAGRLHHQKNQALLLEAFAALRGRDAALWILGEGALRGPLEEQARRLGIADQVHWLGFRENPFSFFRAADCFVLSSDYEGLPNVVIEAMICGTPVVSTRCTYGPEEMIEDGVTGRLVPPGDAGALAGALAGMIDDPSGAKRMGENARLAAIERFDAPVGAATYERLFLRTIAGGHCGRI